MKSSIQIPHHQVILIEAEEVAELVKVGGADLLGEDFWIAPGKIPKIFEIENDARGGIGGDGVSLHAAGPLEEAEEVRLESLLEDRRVGDILIQRDDRFRGGAELGGQAGADVADAFGGEAVEIGFQG